MKSYIKYTFLQFCTVWNSLICTYDIDSKYFRDQHKLKKENKMKRFLVVLGLMSFIVLTSFTEQPEGNAVAQGDNNDDSSNKTTRDNYIYQ